MKQPTSSRLLLAHLISGASAFSVVVLWACAASTWISPERNKWLGVLGLGYPLALLGVLLMLLFTLLLAPRRVWIPLLGLVTTWGFTMDYAPLQLFPPIVPSADTTSLRVMSYNTQAFGAWQNERRDSLLAYLDEQRLDIFCYQEGFPDEKGMQRVRRQLATQGLPHFAAEYGGGASLGIFSRYPIVEQEQIFQIEGNGIVAFWLRPQPKDTLLVVCCHLRSNLLTLDERNEYSQIIHQATTQHQGSQIALSRRLVRKVAESSVVRARMVDALVDYLDTHPKVPTIVCGDMNETPISYSHHRLTSQAQLTDIYRAAGSGIGRSFRKDAIYVRIDQGFCSEHFQPLRARIDQQVDFSDHYPLLMTLRRK